MSQQTVGISGLSLYVPPYRVNLEDWCDWNDSNWGKIQAVVGSSFRMRGPEHNAYTMAATAVLRLIDAFDVDPSRVRFLALGTESSTDNSAGAVIVLFVSSRKRSPCRWASATYIRPRSVVQATLRAETEGRITARPVNR